MELLEQLELWHEKEAFDKIIECIEAIPENERNDELTGLLARAYQNAAKGERADYYEHSLELLRSAADEGDPKWHFRMAFGLYWLNRYDEAIPYLEKIFTLVPDNPETRAFWVDAQNILDHCRLMADAPQESERDATGSFCGSVLLRAPLWDKAAFQRAFIEEWGIPCAEETDEDEDADDILIFDVGDMQAIVSLWYTPVPNGEAETNAANNYMWSGALEAAKAHQGHIVVAVLGEEASLLERAKLYVKLLATACLQQGALGVFTCGTVFEPDFYRKGAAMLHDGGLPVSNLVWIGLYRTEGGLTAYTYGMDVFGKDEMEVLNVQAEPSELWDFLTDIVYYVLEQDVVLQDGETIGFSESQKLPITRSAGVSLPGMTLKIGLEQED